MRTLITKPSITIVAQNRRGEVVTRKKTVVVQ